MASVSSSHLILFIASMMVAASVSGVLIDGVQRLSSAVDDQSLDVSNNIRTDVEIISDPDAGNVYANNQTTLLVKNTGSRRLGTSAGQVDVLIDGAYQTNLSISVLDGPTWDTGNVARIDVDGNLTAGDHRVLLIVDGDEEVFQFRV